MVVPLLDNRKDATFYNYQWAHIHSRIVSVGESLGFATMDLVPYFRSHAPADVKISKKDELHPNALGNAIVAQALVDRLRTLGIVVN